MTLAAAVRELSAQVAELARTGIALATAVNRAADVLGRIDNTTAHTRDKVDQIESRTRLRAAK